MKFPWISHRHPLGWTEKHSSLNKPGSSFSQFCPPLFFFAMPVLVFMLHFIRVDNIAKTSFGLFLLRAFVLVINFSKITFIKLWHTFNLRRCCFVFETAKWEIRGEKNKDFFALNSSFAGNTKMTLFSKTHFTHQCGVTAQEKHGLIPSPTLGTSHFCPQGEKRPLVISPLHLCRTFCSLKLKRSRILLKMSL